MVFMAREKLSLMTPDSGTQPVLEVTGVPRSCWGCCLRAAEGALGRPWSVSRHRYVPKGLLRAPRAGDTGSQHVPPLAEDAGT